MLSLAAVHLINKSTVLKTVLYFTVLASVISAFNVLAEESKNFCVLSQASLSVASLNYDCFVLHACGPFAQILLRQLTCIIA